MRSSLQAEVHPRGLRDSLKTEVDFEGLRIVEVEGLTAQQKLVLRVKSPRTASGPIGEVHFGGKGPSKCEE